MRTAGVILDIYDDAKGFILREKLAGSDLPPALAESHLLSREKLAALPDRLFALVVKDGTQIFRKYATHNAEHLATSIIYFLECGHLLPEEAQKIASINLVNACAVYDLLPPEPLVKRAFIGKALGAAGALMTGQQALAQAKEGMAKTKGDMAAYRQTQVTGQVPAQGAHIQEKAAEYSSTPSVSTMLFDEMMWGTGAKRPPGLRKESDLTGTEMMPAGGSIDTKPMRTNTAKRRANHTESKNAEWVGPVDITGLSAPVHVKEITSTHHCLPGRYPIDSHSQVKQAASYFNDYWGGFDLPERRTYALNLVDRANELGIKVAGRILDYAGRHVGSHLRAELQKRATAYEGHSLGGLYEELKTKVASVSAEDMVGLLSSADSHTGADLAYNKPVVGFRDPFAAVFGVKTAKEQITGESDSLLHAKTKADDDYVWNLGSDYVTGDQLRFMVNRNEDLDKVLGKGFSMEYSKDPVGTFKALPDPQKHVLARLASDNSGGTIRQ